MPTLRLHLRTYLLLIPFLMFVGFPIYWTLITSLQLESSISRLPLNYFPPLITFQNYAHLWRSTAFPTFFLNSFVVAGATTLITLVITSLSGYSLSRYRFRGVQVVTFVLLAIQMFPPIMLVVPMFQIFNNLGLVGTLVPLVCTYSTFMITFCTILMKGFFDTIPKELDEMAMIDGCSRIGALFRVVLPPALPGVIAAGIFAFVFAWNELLFATMFLSQESQMTLPVGLYSLIGQFAVNWSEISTGSIMALVPALMLFAYVQKYLVAGLMTGSVKG